MATQKQKNAISFCNQILSEKFTGDIDNFKEVSNYLALHLDEAKKKKSEPKKNILSTTRLSDYGSYINDYDLDNIDDPYWIVEQYGKKYILKFIRETVKTVKWGISKLKKSNK